MNGGASREGMNRRAKVATVMYLLIEAESMGNGSTPRYDAYNATKLTQTTYRIQQPLEMGLHLTSRVSLPLQLHTRLIPEIGS
jgi:hypothetical protein